ncbi:MAG: leucyl aminopeptidase [Acidobacteria bacterium]|nr:leucyl aminopeptidase [Acidobacteriota bacterium]
MKTALYEGPYYECETDALVLPFFEDDSLDDATLREVDRRLNGSLSSLVAAGELKGKPWETVLLHAPAGVKAQRLLWVGCGRRSECDLEVIRKFGGTAARYLRSRGAKKMALLAPGGTTSGRAAQAMEEGVLLGLFDVGSYKTEDKEEGLIEELVLVVNAGEAADAMQGVERGKITAKAVNFARNLVNEPSSVMTPTEMSERAREMSERFGLDVDILDEPQIKELGMGSFLGVARGSDEPARLIVVTYTPEKITTDETLAFVGKGITFDSGGISLKPSEGMEMMKYDMAGGAAVLGAMRAIAQLRPSVRVFGIVPATENLPSGRAQKPGDVVRSMSGKTIEVVNTDAEGRLILADGISYAKRLGATRIVDLATLTGACVVALGSVYAAILGNDQAMIDDLIAASCASGERLWQLPLHREYREQIKSEIADLKNIGGRKAGTITAAYFLQEFAETTSWVHLDIAGTAWLEEKRPYLSCGPTGMGVRTLIEYAFRSAGGR